MLKRTLSLLCVAAMLLAIMPLCVSAVNSYWGFDDYDTIENPGAPEEITSYPTTITKNSNSLYTITCTTDAGTLSITLVEETWGTFNLGSWKLTDKSNKTHTFVDGSTDMEYVHQLYYSDSEITWSGGNHGGEALVSLKFYDGVSGQEISLANGASKTVNVLHIIEKTNLLLFPDNNNDSINDYTNKNTAYTEDQVYANLTRKYTITGPQVKLNVDYKYTRDTYHARNYSCMFPINKTYGQYCDMFDLNGNMLGTISTVPYGNTTYNPYEGPHNSGNAATRAIVYSENSPYIFDMRINTFKDSVNEFKNANYKTSFWDMNYYYNKLYFTRFDEGQKILHAKDKEVHTECIWMFRYDTDGREPTVGEAPISLNKDYNISFTNTPITDSQWNVNYGALLTDGKASDTFDASNASWFAFWINKNTDGAGVGSATIDLKKTYDISNIKIHLANAVTVMGVSAPKSVKAYSVDASGNVLADLGSFTLDRGDNSIYWSSLSVSGVIARYIKIEFTINTPCSYINEISVYGKEAKEGISTNGSAQNNLLSGLDYDISITNTPIVDSQWNVDYSALLTDGIASNSFNSSNGSWFFFQKGKNATSAGVGSITVDLGGYYDIDKARIHLANAGASMYIYHAQSVKLYGSLDGSEYNLLGEFPIDESDISIYWSELKLDEAVTVKYLKYEITANGDSIGAYVNEIEAYGSKSDYTPYENGDVNADGFVDIFDYMAIKAHCLDRTILTEDELKRSDLNEDGFVDVFDYLQLKSICMQK